MREEAEDAPAIAGAATVIGIVRLPIPGEPEGGALDDLRRQRPDAVIVHTGVAGSAPDSGRVVLALGNSRPNGAAAARLVFG